MKFFHFFMSVARWQREKPWSEMYLTVFKVLDHRQQKKPYEKS